MLNLASALGEFHGNANIYDYESGVTLAGSGKLIEAIRHMETVLMNQPIASKDPNFDVYAGGYLTVSRFIRYQLIEPNLESGDQLTKCALFYLFDSSQRVIVKHPYLQDIADENFNLGAMKRHYTLEPRRK